MYFGVLIGFCVVLVVVGYIANRKNKKDDIGDYFVVSRSLGVILCAGTYGASFLSAGTFIGNTGTLYSAGWVMSLQWLGAIGGIAYLAIVLVPRFWRFGYYNGGLSMPDIFGERFHGRYSRGIFAIAILIVYTVGLAAMYLGLNAVWGYIMPDLPFMFIVIVGGVVVMFYSISGGARGITWTDTICMLVMVAGVLIIFPIILNKIGGFELLATNFAAAAPVDGQSWMSGADLIAPSNASFPVTMTFAWALTWFLGNSSQPHQVTRAYLAKDERTARLAISFCMILVVIIHFASTVIAAYARGTYPPLGRADYAFPSVVVDLLPGFVGGIVLIAVVAAIFSTASTMLIICGQCVGYDIYMKMIKPAATQKEIISLSRITMAIITVIAIIITYFAQSIPTLLIIWSSAFAILGATIAPSLLAAFYWRGATPTGNIASMLVGMGVSLLLNIVPELRPMGLHPLLPAILCSTITLIVVSKLSKPTPQERLDKFFNPLVRFGEDGAKKRGLID